MDFIEDIFGRIIGRNGINFNDITISRGVIKEYKFEEWIRSWWRYDKKWQP